MVTTESGVAIIRGVVPHEGMGDEEARRARFRLEQPYEVPNDEAFGGKDFTDADDIGEIADKLIREYEELRHVAGVCIAYLWEKKGGTLQGKPYLGKCAKTPPLVSYYATSDYTITLAADRCRLNGLTMRQVVALTYHELRHIGPKDDGTTKIVPHEFEGFHGEIARFGFWDAGLERTADTFQRRFDLEGQEG